jgi:lambda family phage portal protein
MGWFTSTLETLAPGLAARRLAAQARLSAAKRLYQAVEASHYRPRRGSGASGDAVMDAAKGRVREFGRYLDENSDIAIGVLDDLVTNVVATGVGIEPMARRSNGDPDDRLNETLRGLWSEFWERPEATGEIPGPELERLICRSWLRDGEVFIQHRTRPVAGGSLPYSLVPLESDWVPFDLIDLRAGITHGIVKDADGRPTSYYVYTAHPGDNGGVLAGLGLVPDARPVPAAQMSHIRFVRRLHQTRGVSILHGVLTRLDDLKEYEESERVAARVAAAFTAYIKRNGDFVTDLDTDTGDRVFRMQPGAIFDTLLPGEDVGTIDTKRPNNDVSNYIAIQERRIAAGSMTRRSSIARDYNGTYSAQRQELVEGAVHYRRLFSYLAHQFYRPVWRRFVDAARLSGAVSMRSLRGVDLASVYAPELRAPALPWIDPKKEIEAHALAIERGLKSRQQSIRDLGGDPRTVDEQLAADPLDVRPPENGGMTKVGPAGSVEAEQSDDTEEAA